MQLIHMSVGKLYRVGGVTFEWHSYLGPVILNRHTEQERQFKNISSRNWAMVYKFLKMTTEQREKHRIA